MQLTFKLDGDVRPQQLFRTPAQETSFQNRLTILKAEMPQILEAEIALSVNHFIRSLMFRLLCLPQLKR